MKELKEDDIARYSRQIILNEVGGKGQKKLLNSKVLIVGAGGLGSPAAYYLAAAGVGTLVLADYDVVDLSNLQRQILHFTEDVGKPKVNSAEEKLRRLNPNLEITTINQKITAENVLDIIGDCDIIIDGSDNFSSRYIVSDSCVLLGKPYIYGGVLRFEGQASVFSKDNGPCYRCLYPEPPPPGMMPSCQEAGVLGVVPGIIGLIQANEALKIIIGIGTTLSGKLLIFDALETSFRTLKIKKRRDCQVCGENPTIKTPRDIEEWCTARIAQ